MAPSLEDRVRTLKIKREAFKMELRMLQELIDAFDPGTSLLSNLRARIEELETEYVAFSKTQTDLDYADEDRTLMADRLALKAQFLNCKARAYDILTKYQPPVVLESRVGSDHEGPGSLSRQTPTSESSDNDIGLPRVHLPTFDGAYTDWPGFADQFKSAVHENPRISECKKLVYLKSCLHGEAAESIASLKNSATNYKCAWEILEQLYNKPAAIVASHIQALFDIPSVHRASHPELRQFLTHLRSHHKALKSLDQPSADTIIIQLCLSRLDNETKVRWREHTRHNPFPVVDELIHFLHHRCQDLEPSAATVLTRRVEGHPKSRPQYTPKLRFATTPAAPMQRAYATQDANVCAICGGPHSTYGCNALLHATLPDRAKLVKEKGLCYNCLKKGHSVSDCKSIGCKVCKRKHHTLLHGGTGIKPQPSTSTQVNATCLNTMTTSQVILSTAVINISDREGRAHRCRVLLDSCAQSHFLTERLVKLLRLPKTKIHIPLTGMNQMTSHVKYSTRARIQSRTTRFAEEATFLIVSEIANILPAMPIDRNDLNLPRNLQLADPEFHTPAEIHGLIGAQLFWHLQCIGQIRLAPPRAILQKTLLGWIVAGELPSPKPRRSTICNVTLDNLHSQLGKFWELEESPRKRMYSVEETECEAHYQANTRRDPGSGRYIVKLPFKENVSKLGESHAAAIKRFLTLERSLSRNPDDRKSYIAFMHEYEELGHMTKSTTSSPSEGYYLPHHAVRKEDSITTKIRVVFDASARTSSGVSLNDILMTGPTLQEDLFTIATRFRTHKIVLTADIAKMYRQIELAHEDRRYHKILWRDDPSQQIATYELKTVTYGTASASYLAIKSLHQLADDEGRQFPNAAAVLRNDFYVDDLLTGADTVEEAIALRDELLQLTRKGGLELRQWSSNDQRVLPSAVASTDNIHMAIAPYDSKKTLGLYWNRATDTLSYTVKSVEPLRKVTKRNILSRIAQLFDPLGLLGPTILKAKLFIQQLWQLQIHWDESIPIALHTAWQLFESQLPAIQTIALPRRITNDNCTQVELHGFCDASEKAYGACIYLRSVNVSGSHMTRLICSKSRVAPLKTISLPRLELCAAVLLIKLYQSTAAALKLSINSCTFWTDSMIVLHWIDTPPHTLKTFVANRVNEIQEVSDHKQWRHVPSLDNPADCLSRGLEPQELKSNDLWYTGPQWLRQTETTWPDLKRSPIDIPERRTATVLTTMTNSDVEYLKRFSSLHKMQRTVAYMLRFSHNTRHPQKRTGPLESTELGSALERIIKSTQEAEFRKDIRNLSNKNHPYKGKLIALNPFLDDLGILRVGGRISQAAVTHDQKHPILLPSNHYLTTLIVREYHLKQFHAGMQGTLNAIRQTYWPINAARAIKKCIRTCITCHRANPSTPKYQMGCLPTNRVTLNRPFLITGIDYCGPLFIKEKRLRNTKTIKAYVAIFVCFSTKAIHIELVSDLTTSAFLASLRRFFARRGKSSDIYSDNAKNFVGADRELHQLHEAFTNSTNDATLRHYTEKERIKWHFIPPRAPNFGGLWEAAVKSAKRHLVRVVGRTMLTYEAMTTYLTEIEGILNSRPLTPLSSDPNDLTALTPAHFLIGDLITSVPEHDVTAIPASRLSMWQHVQQMRQHFWTRWHKEYLNQLTVRSKWHDSNPTQVKEGALVIIRQDNLPPMHWPLGRIIALHPGKDNVTRVVTVKTSGGEYKRSVKHISPLPLDTSLPPTEDTTTST